MTRLVAVSFLGMLLLVAGPARGQGTGGGQGQIKPKQTPSTGGRGSQQSTSPSGAPQDGMPPGSASPGAGPRRGPGYGPGGRAMGICGMGLMHANPDMMRSELSLTDNQIKQIQTARQDFFTKRIRLRSQIQEAQLKLSNLFQSDMPDMNEVLRLQSQINNLRGQLNEARTRAEFQFLRTLTPQQRVALRTECPRYGAYGMAPTGGHGMGMGMGGTMGGGGPMMGRGGPMMGRGGMMGAMSPEDMQSMCSMYQDQGM